MKTGDCNVWIESQGDILIVGYSGSKGAILEANKLAKDRFFNVKTMYSKNNTFYYSGYSGYKAEKIKNILLKYRKDLNINIEVKDIDIRKILSYIKSNSSNKEFWSMHSDNKILGSLFDHISSM